PGDEEDDMRMGETLHQRTAKEERGRDHQRVAAAHDVGKPAGEESADKTTDQQGCDGEAKAIRRGPAARHEAERLGQSVLRAVDGAAVISEQKAADRGDGDNRADESHVRALRTRFNHSTLPCISSPGFPGEENLLAVTRVISRTQRLSFPSSVCVPWPCVRRAAGPTIRE